MAASSSVNILARMLDANKLKGAENFVEWELDLRIVLNSEKIGYILEGPIPVGIPDDTTEEERVTFTKWQDDDLRVKSYILGSVSSELKMQLFSIPDAYGMITKLRETYQNQE